MDAPIPVPDELRSVHAGWVAKGCPPQRAFPWPRDRWIDQLPEHEQFIRSLPGELDRPAVAERCARAASSPDGATEAFVVMNVWGRGDTGHGPWRTAHILEATADAVERLRNSAATALADGAVAAYAALAGDLNIASFGESYATKFLYFCQPADARPRALILDERVRTWVARHGRPDLDRGGLWSVTRYAAYLEQTHLWAESLGCAPDDVEYLIFHMVAKERGDRWADDW